MRKRKDSIAALLSHSAEKFQEIEKAYNQSLQDQTIAAELRIDIKNLCENLRSILDYLAHEIRETHCSTPRADERFYFPIFSDRKQFESQARQWYPGLDSTQPDLWAYLESVQPYNPGCAWLGDFNRLNNENKHGNLVEQTRTETQEIRVSRPGDGQVSWNPSNVKFGSGVYIGGVPVDPKTQMPVPHPSQKVERIIWVDLRFEGIGTSALQLLKQSLDGVKRITSEAYRWL